MSPNALTKTRNGNEHGDVSFRGEILQYHGKLNQNARSIIFLEDTGYFDGNVDSSAPLNMAVFISPGYISDYAWVKLNDPAFAAKVLADGRTIGHPRKVEKASAARSMNRGIVCRSRWASGTPPMSTDSIIL